MGIAPLVAAVQSKPLHWMFGVPAQPFSGATVLDGGTGGLIGLKVEIFINSAWTDITSFVYRRGVVSITRGKADETAQIQPQTAKLILDNRDGRFSPRNRDGAYYGLLGRNTPLRVSRLNNGVRRYRFYGEVPAWPTTSDISGRDVIVSITAAGMLRRLRAGTPPALSPLYRAYTETNAIRNVVAYWPCEDGTNSASIASGLPSGTPMTVITGSPSFAANATFKCSASIPTFNGSAWFAPVSFSGTWTDNVVRFLMQIPSGGDLDGAIVARFFTTGTVARFDFVYNNAFGGEMSAIGYDAAGNTLFTLGPYLPNTGGFNGGVFRIGLALRTMGTSVEASSQEFRIGETSAGSSSTTLASSSVGAITGVYLNPGANLSGTAVGHVSVQSKWDSLVGTLGPALSANIGESPSARFARLTTESAVNAVVVDLGQTADGTTLGYQPSDTFPNLLQQVPDADLGLMFEARDQTALVCRIRPSLYNQGTVYNSQHPGLTLDMALHQLSAPLVPVDDDLYTRNDVTVTRIGGSSARQQATSGPLSIQPPPDGVGPYGASASISLGDDGQLPDQAGWRLHFGTVDEPRYPQISINLRYPTFTGSVDAMNAALTLDIGDRVVIKNPPTPEFPPDDISVIVQGYTETLSNFEHDMVLNCSPESPYRVGVLDDAVLGHADTDGSAIDVPIKGSDVTFSVATTGADSPLWTTDGADFPFDVNVGGERMTVTNITGSSSPQSFTNVIRGVNSAPIPLGADGTFETGITGWTPTGGTFAAGTTQAHGGTASGLLTVTGAPSQTFVRTPFIPVTPGTPIAATLWVLTASGSPHCLCVIDFFDAGQNYQSSYASSAVSAPGVWTQQQSVAVVPAGIAYARIGPTVNLSPPAGTAIFVDDVSLTSPPSHTAGTDVRLWQPSILSM